MNLLLVAAAALVLVAVGIWCANVTVRVPEVVLDKVATIGLTNEIIYDKLKGHDWMLACATAAYTDTLRRGGGMDFGLWWSLSSDNWTKSVQDDMPGLSSRRLKSFLLWFARNNKHKSMEQIAAESAAAVGKPVPMIIGPGESVTVTVPLDGKEHDASYLDWRKLN